MANPEWDESLADAASDVLETMFFTPVCGPAAPRATLVSPHVAARLTFEGTPSGSLTVSVSEPALCSLAASFLPSEESDSSGPVQLTGVARELANMICGSLLSRVKTEQHFRLSSPEILPDAAAVPEAPNRSFDLGDGSIDLWLALEPHAG